MAGRHSARAGGLRRVGDVIVEHPFPAGAVLIAALVVALVVTPLGMGDLTPAPDHARSPAAGAAPVVALSVPNVIGLSASRAGDTLRARGFSVEVRTESGESATGRTDDVVVRQTPGGGAHVTKGTTVALTVAPAGSSVSTPPQNASGATGPGTVSAPAGSGPAPGPGGALGAAGAGNAGGGGGSGAAGSGGAVPAPPAPAPAPQPPAVPSPTPPVTPPPVVQVPTPPVPSLPLPVSPLGVVSGFLRGVV